MNQRIDFKDRPVFYDRIQPGRVEVHDSAKYYIIAFGLIGLITLIFLNLEPGL